MHITTSRCEQFRSIDGRGNNLQNPDWGKAGEAFPRRLPVDYADLTGAPSGADRPNPRVISNNVMADPSRNREPAMRSGMVWAWGQFIDHDITSTPNSGAMDWNISVPVGDPAFDPKREGKAIIPFSRSTAADGTGTGPDNPRQQINAITSWLDGSMVYGSDAVRAAALRSFEEGKLRVAESEHGPMLPANTLGLPNDNPTRRPTESLLLAGDTRANENLALVSLQTLFVREHNRVADELARQHPEWDDQELYLRARRQVGAEIAAITYNEFLPALLGPDALPAYAGYQPEVDGRIGNEFATAAYRMGHSQIDPIVWREAADGGAIPEKDLPLVATYFAPERLSEGGIEPLLRGLTRFIQEPTDEKITSQVRNMLFGRPGHGGMDLAALNIQRGRDHGLPNYNAIRQAYGFEPITSFAQLTSDPVKVGKLTYTYGEVEKLDAWVGLLAEDPAPEAAVGPTLKSILVDQFTRLRDGDRFWYQNDPGLADQREQLDSLSLADVIRRNTDIGDDIDDSPFFGEKFIRSKP
ncbi:MAG: peroxidase family protein [Vulcanimicrobiota bacterium]